MRGDLNTLFGSTSSVRFLAFDSSKYRVDPEERVEAQSQDLTYYHIAEPAVEEAIERLFNVEERYFDMDTPT